MIGGLHHTIPEKHGTGRLCLAGSLIETLRNKLAHTWAYGDFQFPDAIKLWREGRAS